MKFRGGLNIIRNFFQTYSKSNSPAKWVIIQKTILRNFLNKYIQQQLDQWIEFDDYITTHKTRV